jgi:uncharacterized membrane-anchored protein YitT (DUF2179 family)
MIKWLLRDNPALLGDLTEERANGRSRAWYFRQILVAIARSMISDVRMHPVLLARAVLAAVLTYVAFASITAIAIGILYGTLTSPQTWGKVNPLSWWIYVPMAEIPSFVTGWLVIRTHRTCTLIAIVAMIVMWLWTILPYPSWMAVAALPGFIAGALLEIRRHARSTQDGIGGDRIHGS